MRDINQLFKEYEVSHQNPTNVAIHKIAVPVIFFCVLAMLSWIKVGPVVWLNLAVCITPLVLGYYYFLSPKLASIVTAAIIPMHGLIYYFGSSGLFAPTVVALFVLAWIMQFVGHHIEGKKPSFIQDLLFLLIGPLWTTYKVTAPNERSTLKSS